MAQVPQTHGRSPGRRGLERTVPAWVPRAMTGTHLPGDLRGTPGSVTPLANQGSPVAFGPNMDVEFQSIHNAAVVRSYQLTGGASDIRAGDQMPDEWRWISYLVIWRGTQNKEKRPPIDIKKVKKMFERRN